MNKADGSISLISRLEKENEALRRDIRSVIEYVEKVCVEADEPLSGDTDNKLAGICSLYCANNAISCFREGECPWICENWKWNGDLK